MPHFIENRITHATARDMFHALDAAWKLLLGAEPKRASLLVLIAHWALETGSGHSMHCWNVGNVKGKPDGSDGRSWTFFRCNEVIGGKVVWFDPPHPGCCFRAFDTLEEGVADYLAIIHKRFAASWPAVEAGDPAAYAQALKAQHYYTADETAYTRTLVALFHQLDKELVDDTEPPPGPDLTTVDGQRAALEELGFVMQEGYAGLKAGIRLFQQHDGALTVDGVVGPKTRAALQAALDHKRALG